MRNETIERLVWVLIYGGALVAGLGLAVGIQVALGLGLVAAGAVGVAAGVVLIWVRSRRDG